MTITQGFGKSKTRLVKNSSKKSLFLCWLLITHVSGMCFHRVIIEAGDAVFKRNRHFYSHCWHVDSCEKKCSNLLKMYCKSKKNCKVLPTWLSRFFALLSPFLWVLWHKSSAKIIGSFLEQKLKVTFLLYSNHITLASISIIRDDVNLTELCESQRV